MNKPSPIGQTFAHFWEFYEQYPQAALECLFRVVCAQSGGRVDIPINELGIVTDEGFTPTLGLVVASDRRAAMEVVSIAPVDSVAVDMQENELTADTDEAPAEPVADPKGEEPAAEQPAPVVDQVAERAEPTTDEHS